jgi:hypothetical protein
LFDALAAGFLAGFFAGFFAGFLAGGIVVLLVSGLRAL